MSPAFAGNASVGAQLAAPSLRTIGATSLLRPFMDHPIVDRTRVAGNFDIQMVWVPDNPNLFPNTPEQPDLPSIPVALKEQLGLELVPGKGSQGSIVIDHIEEPTPN